LEDNEAVQQLFIDFKTDYDSVRREVMYSILIHFGVPLKLVRPTKLCLHETYNKVYIDKHFSNFPIQNGLKQLLSTFFCLWPTSVAPLILFKYNKCVLWDVGIHCDTPRYAVTNVYQL
jgi:hypothetical protein